MKMRNPGNAGRTLMVAILFIGAVFIFNSRALAQQTHSFSTGECTICHDESAAGQSLTTAVETERIHPTCDNCHGSCEQWGNHEEKKLTARQMVVALPDADGEIICITCHDPHPEAVPGTGRCDEGP